MRFAVKPQTRATDSRFPLRAAIREDLLKRRPYRSNITRPLAAALSTLASSSAMAQGLWSIPANPNSRYTLEGRLAYYHAPTEMIEHTALESLLTRLFNDAGIRLSTDDRVNKQDAPIEYWNGGRRVGVALLGREDFPSDGAWASYLAETIGSGRVIPGDPRAGQAGSCPPLSAKEQAQVDHAVSAFGPLYDHSGPVSCVGPHGEQILWLEPRDLVVMSTPPGQEQDPTVAVQARAEALQRLESQVAEFITYLQSQGI